jgi:mRNA interferase RelE/StbE
MIYCIDLLRSAQKQLRRIPDKYQDRIISAIKSLAENPRPKSCIKLSARPAWRIRMGDYRIIYEINDEQTYILIIAIGHRREVYARK